MTEAPQLPPAGPRFPLEPDVLEVARRALPLGLCPECFGRTVGRWGRGLSNPERAERMLAGLGAPLPPVPSDGCAVCRSAFDRWPTWIERVQRAGAGLEWRRFACGSRWDPEVLAHEESVWLEVGTSHGESLRGAFNRELGKRVQAATATEGAPDHPDVVFLADVPVGRVEVTVLPLYLEGRYRKLDRTLPQTKWPCRSCQGRGCERCHGTGKTYPESVEEIVAAPFLRAAESDGSRFHGMGREDIDARMLGRGRPFVLEILHPRRRTLDLPALLDQLKASAAGRVEVDSLVPCEAARVVQIKEASPEKSYRVGVVGAVGEA